ncbi:MAG: hypothetical protein K2N70_06125 [Helicobacter sp.]|nr:hypothetical protein [Helicobacter sp.]
MRPLLHVLIANALHLLLVCRFAPNAALTPNPLARSSIVCAPHGLCPYSTALRLCYAFWLEHRRCALWLGRSHDEQ